MGDSPSERRVLIVDDHVDSADGVAALLRGCGMTVEVAYDGEEALATARRFLPDAVVLDLNLPALDGFEVARCLRADPLLRDVALLTLSGRLDPEVRAKAMAIGIEDHLSKPADFEQLRSALERLTRTSAI